MHFKFSLGSQNHFLLINDIQCVLGFLFIYAHVLSTIIFNFSVTVVVE
jgi:hypothetical protein